MHANLPILRTTLGCLATAFLLVWGHSATAQESTAPKGNMVYVVKDSDQLGRLAQELLLTTKLWPRVAALNKLEDPHRIYPGQKLVIPLRYLKAMDKGAQVVAVHGDVKTDGAPLHTGVKLPEGARIQAGPRSSATLKMADGSRVTLTPDTLAQVIESRRFGAPESARSATTTWYSGVMRLVQGGLDIAAARNVNRTSPFRVQTATATIGVRGTEFRVAQDTADATSSRTEVTEGKVRADHSTQHSGADLPAGFGAVINPAQKTIQAVKLLPAPDLKTSPATVQPIDGVAPWPFGKVEGASTYRIQVARDASFEQLVDDLKTPDTYANLALPEPGQWHVRVRAVDGLGLEGFNSTQALEYKPERILLPAFWLIGGKSTFEFKLPRPQEGLYRAIVARDRAFLQVVQQEVLRKNEWEVKGLKSGTYYLKIESVDPKAGVSQRYTFDMPEKWGEGLTDSVALLEPIQ
jgi:hypothetical protein